MCCCYVSNTFGPSATPLPLLNSVEPLCCSNAGRQMILPYIHVPERALRWREFALVEFLWGLWSPGWDYPSERIEAVTGTLRTGDTVEYAVQYYRDTVRPQAASLAGSLVGPGRPSLDAVPPVRTPTLVAYGDRDGCIDPELFAHAGEIIDDCRVVRVPGAGHFLHRERPEAVGEEVVEYVTD